MTDPAIRAAFAEAALKRAAGKGWGDVTLHELAALAGRPIADFYPLTAADAHDCIDEYFDRAAARAAPAPDLTAQARDRVFDAAMSRFEAMEDHRAALIALDKALDRDAIGIAAALARRARTARWLLALAGADGDSVSSAARAQALAFVLRDARRAWAGDLGGDFAKTMAVLDKGLRRADSFFEGIRRMAEPFRPGAARSSSREEAKPAD